MKLAAEQQNTAIPAVLYIDISLYKQIGDGQETRVTETNGKLEISIEVPESMRSTENGVTRIYRVVCIHNGVAEVLEGTYDPTTHLFTFETDRFSTYALTYQVVKAVNPGSNIVTLNLSVYKDFHHLRLTAKADKASQKLSYAKVAGADGYFIYGAKYGQKLKLLADMDATVTEYTDKKLKQASYYRYQVKAYKLIDGEKVILMTSKIIYSVTDGKKYANPSKVTSDTTSVELAVGKTKTLNCRLVLPKGKKMKEYTAAIRYESTNKAVATVNSKGKITAKKKGTCYVYAYAQNGVYKKIKVTVK